MQNKSDLYVMLQFKSNKTSFECMNDVSLTWEDAFTNLVESVHAPEALTSLDVGQMIGSSTGRL